jgi:ATP-dependent Clp protease ATP-binding subunit ClpA
MLGRLTDTTKRAMAASAAAARALGHDFIGTEHLLLGLAGTAGTASDVLREYGVDPARARDETARQRSADDATGGRAARDALSSIGIDVGDIQRRADDTFGPGALDFPRPAWSLPAKQAIQQSLREATDLGRDRIDTGHLLLGILAADDSAAATVLIALDVDVPALRRAVRSRS